MQTVDSSIIQRTFKKGHVLKAHHGNMISNLGDTIECSKEYQKGLPGTMKQQVLFLMTMLTEVGTYQAIQIGTHLMMGAIGFSSDIREKMKTGKQHQRRD